MTLSNSSVYVTDSPIGFFPWGFPMKMLILSHVFLACYISCPSYCFPINLIFDEKCHFLHLLPLAPSQDHMSSPNSCFQTS